MDTRRLETAALTAVTGYEFTAITTGLVPTITHLGTERLDEALGERRARVVRVAGLTLTTAWYWRHFLRRAVRVTADVIDAVTP